MQGRFISLLLAALMTTACGARDAAEQKQDTTAQQTAAEETAAMPEADEMTQRSLYRLGSTNRLKAAIAKARSGEKTTIAYIGGSITEGVGGTPATCYARVSFDSFAQMFGTGDNVEYVNAGISGTPSRLGNLRVKKDVLDKSPDAVFIEFCVNDSMDELAKQSYESLVKTVLESDTHPAVILVCNRLKNGYTAQENMKAIADHYDITVVSPADAFTPAIESGEFVWEDNYADESHPNDKGHALVAGFITYMWQCADAAPDTGEYILPENELFGAPYAFAQLVTPDMTDSDIITIEDTGAFKTGSQGPRLFTSCWRLDEGKDPFKFKVEGSSLFIVFQRNKTSDMGAFDVYINGSKIKTVNTCQSDAWGDPYAEQIIKFQSDKTMDVEIVPTDDSAGKKIRILGIGAR
ncbi:MAG: SGNH/GDSL hydrolase family protein [Oscillospiraceae bacterium]|nr:SGNH/GDSL hydrolase family protein [Oscillospiraceae bacterium]